MTQSRRHAIHVGIEQNRSASASTLKCANQIADGINPCRQAQACKLLLQIAANVFLMTRSARNPNKLNQRLTKTIYRQFVPPVPSFFSWQWTVLRRSRLTTDPSYASLRF